MTTLRTLGTEPSTRPPTFATLGDVAAHIENARALRAQVTADLLVAASKALARPAHTLLTVALRWRRQRRTRAALLRCSDRVLADIGIERADVALVARGIDPHEHRLRDRRAWRRWYTGWADLQAMQAELRRPLPGLDAARVAQRLWRQSHAMAYDDRELGRPRPRPERAPRASLSGHLMPEAAD